MPVVVLIITWRIGPYTVLTNYTLLCIVVCMKTFISSKEASERLGISRRRIQQLLSEGRIRGARLVGHSWIIPTPIKLVRGKRGPSGVADSFSDNLKRGES